MLFVLTLRAQATQKVYVPPQLTIGTTLEVNTPSDEFVYGFTYYIWQVLHHWPNDGEENFDANIHMLQAYFTPHFYQTLKSEAALLKEKRQSSSRIRRLTGLHGALYQSHFVQQIDNHTWLVTLHMQVSEYVSESQLRIKEVGYEYQLYVTLEDFNREANPWGLVISGYAKTPHRLEDSY